MNGAYKILHLLRMKGFNSYIVGGFVRDYLLYDGINIGDIDIATSAKPEEVIDMFSKCGFRVIPTGIDHGTVTVMVDGISYEITTYRKDVSCDGRNAIVSFADSVDEDLSRRDFSVNAIAYCPIDNRYIDPFDGKRDIKDKILRTVGDPEERFREDYLRMFRAYRFNATLQFKLANATEDAIGVVVNDKWEDKISIERIKMEIDKCFAKAKQPSIMIKGLYRSKLLNKILPELAECYGFKQNRYHQHDVFHHTIYAVDGVPVEYPLIRWAALLHDLGKLRTRVMVGEDYTFHNHESISEVIAQNILKRFKFSNKDIFYIANLIRHHMFQCIPEMKDSAIRRFIASLGMEYIDDICILKYADRVGKGTVIVSELNIDNTKLKTRVKQILEKDNCFKISDLAVDGYDVMTIKKISPSKEVGEYLKKLYEIVIEEPSLNNRDDLSRILLEKFV